MVPSPVVGDVDKPFVQPVVLSFFRQWVSRLMHKLIAYSKTDPYATNKHFVQLLAKLLHKNTFTDGWLLATYRRVRCEYALCAAVSQAVILNEIYNCLKALCSC